MRSRHDHIDIATTSLKATQRSCAVEVDAEEILVEQALKLRLQGMDLGL